MGVGQGKGQGQVHFVRAQSTHKQFRSLTGALGHACVYA